jgi:glycosyltransferase involved in cell wall biosynthesis
VTDGRYTIAHIMPCVPPGGVEHATLHTIQALEGPRFRNIAFCIRGFQPLQKLFDNSGIETAEYNAVEPGLRHLREFWKASVELKNELIQRDVDVVHCADHLAARYSMLAVMFAKLPVVCHIRERRTQLSFLDLSLLLPVDRFVFVSRDAWRTFGHKVSPSRGTVVYEAVDIPAVSRSSSVRAEVCAELGIDPAKKIVGMLARLAPAKDYPTFVKAARLLSTGYPGVHFLVMGDFSQLASNRQQYAEMQDMIARYGLGPLFTFADHRGNVDRIVEAVDVCALSTHSEGLSWSVLNVMAHGKPLAATQVGGIPEVVIHEETGLLHPDRDHETLAHNILSLLRDPEYAADLGARARHFISANFSREKFANDMANVYEEILSGRPTPDRAGSSSPDSFHERIS